MKTVLAAVLVLALAITGISLWGAVHARRVAVSSSQIFVHGTPVCVIRQGESIIASVGICGPLGGDPQGDDSGNGEDFHGETPFHGEPRLGLPPGHPPIDTSPTFGEGRRILI
ncbi:MAG: hypothetical protein B7Z62_01105 [Deltaproteobacteria bacterium 37-65-8]|nr:hypothetical protein [Deltaproteobacteria bacterium]OYV99283.1 MAG: hypothetical protein B7Z62_01105 [Deltaproteobacteria bacterium 37-65-8]HQT98550.1 hypothetical protein [Thermodesulfobacteriota bacterium]